MATVPFNLAHSASVPSVSPSEVGKPLHRIHNVRLRQGVSLRSAARSSGTDIRQLRLQEQESTDLRITDLKKWQKALGVPLQELLVESDDPLSRPVMERARMVKLMKTATAIKERTESQGIERLAQMLADQLVEIMPELKEVSPWHNFGQRRSLEEYGAIVDRQISEDTLYDSCRWD